MNQVTWFNFELTQEYIQKVLSDRSFFISKLVLSDTSREIIFWKYLVSLQISISILCFWWILFHGTQKFTYVWMCINQLRNFFWSSYPFYPQFIKRNISFTVMVQRHQRVFSSTKHVSLKEFDCRFRLESGQTQIESSDQKWL